MQTVKFNELNEGEQFVFESDMFEKRLGTHYQRGKMKGTDYNAVDVYRKDIWLFEANEEVLRV